MAKHNFLIDKLTNSIEEVKSKKSLDTEVISIGGADLKSVLKKNGWHFNWKAEAKYSDRQLYKLVIKEEACIQGLISLQLIENYIEMHLIESAPHNYGAAKMYLGVPGNLVAFACKMSWEAGFAGFVAFRAKTKLIEHYIETLGAELIFKDRMSISGESSRKLVNSYYKNFFDVK